MRARRTMAVLGLLVLVTGLAVSRLPADTAPSSTPLYTAIYDVSDMPVFTKANGAEKFDARIIVALIKKSVELDDGAIVSSDNGQPQLVIRATQNDHGGIRRVFDDLRKP